MSGGHKAPDSNAASWRGAWTSMTSALTFVGAEASNRSSIATIAEDETHVKARCMFNVKRIRICPRLQLPIGNFDQRRVLSRALEAMDCPPRIETRQTGEPPRRTSRL